MTTTLRQVWQAQRDRILSFAILVMSIAALIWLSYEFWRLLFQTGYWGAIDLLGLHSSTRRWFAEANNESILESLYPPATFVLLFPLVGWLDETPLRWFWSAITLASLWGLIYLVVDASGAKSRLERAFVALIPLSIYGTGATIGNGQLGLLVLVLLLFGIRWMHQPKDWRADLGALIFIASLLKPSIAAPFGWIVLLVCGQYRRAVLVGVGYVILTLVASAFKKDSLPILLQAWLGRGASLAAIGGSSNLSIWLGSVGLPEWILLAAFGAFAALGGWVWIYRDRDLWLILGVTALVARMWTYHAWYDDILILLPMVALYRIAKSAGTAGDRDVIAGVLFALSLLFSLAPGGLYLFPPPWNSIYVAIQVGIWILDLIFLVVVARRAQDFAWQPPSSPS